MKNDWELIANFNNGEIIDRQDKCVLKKGELNKFYGNIIINTIKEGIFIDLKKGMIRFSLVTGKVFE